MQKNTYDYSVTLKLVAGKQFKLLQAEYPGATDISLASKTFYDYTDCVTSCRKLMNDALEKMNAVTTNETPFVISNEINPSLSKQPTISKDWQANEVARMWIFDSKYSSTDQIVAVANARIFETGKVELMGLN